MDLSNEQLCRICIASYGNCTQMISIFGEDSLWKKITTLADVKIERHDTLPQHVCITCAKNTISACLFKKKCEDADNFFRQQLLIQKIQSKSDSIPNIHTQSLFDNEAFVPYKSVTQNDENVNDKQDTLRNENDANVPFRRSSPYTSSQREAPDENNLENYNDKNANVNESAYFDLHDDHSVENKEFESSNNRKLPFDFQSIRLMHEYMQQQLHKFSGLQNLQNDIDNNHNCEGSGLNSASGSDHDEDEQLPLIPEIEIITPSDDMGVGSICSNAGNSMNDDGQTIAHMKGYQCPHCFQIFEMKQILKVHMQTVHNATAPVYECSHCKKTYFYKRFLEKHIRRGRCVKKRRNQTKPMKCSDCHVLFPTGHHLGWHKRTGCPSKTAKIPLQQFFKQNVVQYNNFPKRIGIRKPENAIYLHNRKLIMASNKRKGRTRIKLDAKKIALAKQLILRDATTTVIANELNISRTFAWRLRKSLVNGVSLHERVIDPAEEEENTTRNSSRNIPTATTIGKATDELKDIKFTPQENLTEHIKTEVILTDAENSVQDSKFIEQNSIQLNVNESQVIQQAVATSVIQRNDQAVQMRELFQAHNKMHKENQNHSAQSLQFNDHINQKEAEETDNNNPWAKEPNDGCPQIVYQQHYLGKTTPVINQVLCSDFSNFQSNDTVLSAIPQLPASVAPPVNHMPVNLSVRPISSLQNTDKKSSLLVATNKKKLRKPNVFIDDEKYALAKLMMTQSASTMEIAKALNVSQMTAWKVRDAIIKGIPLTYRGKRLQLSNHNESVNGVTTVDTNSSFPRRQVESRTEGIDIKSRQNVIERKQQMHLKHGEKLQPNNQHEQVQRLIQNQQLLQPQQGQKQPTQVQENQKGKFQAEQQNQGGQVIQPAQQTKQLNIQRILVNSKRRLKAAERQIRDKEITREILQLIKEDSTIQYWKVSARLAEKGYAISPSSVCQKLKSMGFHRRWKPGDKAQLIGSKQLKITNNLNSNVLDNTPTAQLVQTANSEPANFEHQDFEIGGTHFLSAFTS